MHPASTQSHLGMVVDKFMEFIGIIVIVYERLTSTLAKLFYPVEIFKDELILYTDKATKEVRPSISLLYTRSFDFFLHVAFACLGVCLTARSMSPIELK